MKTDFKNLNLFEAAIVSWSLIGVFVVAMISFASLTPAKQFEVKEAFNIFDIHEQAQQTLASTEFVLDIPNVFYEQFYVAFVEVTTLPDTIREAPVKVASNIISNFNVAINSLSDQVAVGYASTTKIESAKAEVAQLPYDGKIMGAMIEFSDQLETTVIRETKPRTETLQIPYSFVPPDFNQLIIPLR